MASDKSHSLWQNADDRVAVQGMLDDLASPYWQKCYEFVNTLVQMQAKKVAEEQRDDIAQNVMMRIHRYLPNFKFGCAFTTWVYSIVHSCITDYYRRSRNFKQHVSLLSEIHSEDGYGEDMFASSTFMTAEEELLIKEQLEEVIEFLDEYIATHAHKKRNLQIIKMSLFEGRSYEEIAKVAGCSAAMVGYVVRAAQRYLREKLRFLQ